MAHHCAENSQEPKFRIPCAALLPQTFYTVQGGKADLNSEGVGFSEIGGFGRLLSPSRYKSLAGSGIYNMGNH
jgi:hypothetical protein